MKISNEDIIKGIIQQDSEALQYLYREVYTQIRWLVIHNHGCEQDAKDIFQESMIVLYRKIRKGTLSLNCNLSTYIYSVCRLLWLKELQRKGRYQNAECDEVLFISEGDDGNQGLEETKKQLFSKHFNELSKDCKKILNLYLNGVSVEEITKAMGFSSEQYTMERKYRCKQKLMDKIIHNPIFRKIKDEL
jgi:RNA polymerase sigma factor (sigma-70 family)